MKKSSLLLFVLIFGITFSQQKPAPREVQTPKRPVTMKSAGSFYGSIFSDYLYVFQEPQIVNPAAGASGRNEFTLRRASIGYDYAFTRDVSANIEYDAASAGVLQAYADVKNLAPMVDLRMGLMRNPSAETIEKIWEYRSLDAFVLERNGLLNEFDQGVLITARTNPMGSSYATLGVYNGSGTAAETNKIKKYTFTAGMWFDRYNMAELYVDYENVGFGRSTINTKAFYGMKMQRFVFGAEAFYRMNRKFAGTKDVTPAGASLFGWFDMMNNVRGVVRADIVDNDLSNSNVGFRDIYIIAGLDYSPVPDVHLMPNVQYTKQMKKGSTPINADIMIVRLTAGVSIPSIK